VFFFPQLVQSKAFVFSCFLIFPIDDELATFFTENFRGISSASSSTLFLFLDASEASFCAASWSISSDKTGTFTSEIGMNVFGWGFAVRAALVLWVPLEGGAGEVIDVQEARGTGGGAMAMPDLDFGLSLPGVCVAVDKSLGDFIVACIEVELKLARELKLELELACNSAPPPNNGISG
jgi:hypothetical protein